MKSKHKIIFVIPSLMAGGAERIMSFIAKKIDNSVFEAVLIVIGFEKDNVFDLGSVKTIYLNKPRVLTSFFSLFKSIIKEKPAVVMSSISHLNTVLAIISLAFPKTKFIGREVNIESVLKDHPEEANRYFPAFIGEIRYKLLDRIICQSNDMMNDFVSESKINNAKLVLINNPITEKFRTKELKREKKKNHYHFITVGSLERRKGYPRIIEALSKLDVQYTYTIIGKGSQFESVFEIAKSLGVEGQINHIPFTKEVPRLLAESDIFLQGSYVEGFPNALLESCAVGTPVIAFDAPGGINEIVENHINGFIVKDEEEFLKAIKIILNSKKFDPKTVSESVYKKYSEEIIIKKYEKLFSELAN